MPRGSPECGAQAWPLSVKELICDLRLTSINRAEFCSAIKFQEARESGVNDLFLNHTSIKHINRHA